MKKLLLIFILFFTSFSTAQNRNELLTGAYYYFEMNASEGNITTAISELIFDGTDSASFKMISPDYGDAGKIPYTIQANGELEVKYGDGILYHGAVKEDGTAFIMCLTDSCYFSDYGMGVGIRADPNLTDNELRNFYNILGYIPASSVPAFPFTGSVMGDSVFYCSGIVSDSVKYWILENGKINFLKDDYLVESVFADNNKIGVGCHTNSNVDGMFAAINNDLQLDDLLIDKKFKFFQFFNGLYKDVSMLEMNCRSDGTGDYTKRYLVNQSGNMNGNFTYRIKNNTLYVIEDGDTLSGAISDDLELFFLLRKGESAAAFCAGVAEIDQQVGVDYSKSAPGKFVLEQNYPNPFNPVTNLGFQISESGLVVLKVFDVLGNEVATLVNEVKPSGSYTVRFDGSKLSSGVYIYKLTAAGFSATKKLTLLK